MASDISDTKTDETDATGINPPDSQGSIQAAVARTLTRGAALYFSRPVRLFRPSKVSGWHSLRGLAAYDGVSLTPSYISSLIKSQGFRVIPKHFFPPMAVNALLGTVLWTSYAEASAMLHPHIGSHSTAMAALAGVLAGGAQGGSGRNSWSHAWKEVFRGAPPPPSSSRHETIEEIRKVRSWMREVGDMAGRGWSGFGYTLGKDLTGTMRFLSYCIVSKLKLSLAGFAVFFAIFDLTRRMGLRVKAMSDDATRSVESPKLLQKPSSPVIAGLSYEVIGRPWDAARRAVRLNFVTNQEYRSPLVLVTHKIQQEGQRLSKSV
ncbi:hypothetical protein B0H11DRAFT_2203277, partial [Mycena galericulata]